MIRFKQALITSISLLFAVVEAYPQITADPIFSATKKWSESNFKKTNFYKTTYIAAPFILSGIALYGPGKRFQNLRYEFAPDFSSPVDDYIQYSSLISLYAIRVAGIKGRSSWSRLLVTHALSAITMAVITNGVKYTVQEPRPYGYGNNSYPSGHIAFAFMNAGMIHHEFGLTRSPWYSIGAYSLASATAILRILNNKHYLHDVVLGAGIGILSTELGYMFSDMLFREKGILLSNKDYGEIDISRQGSYIGLTAGFNMLLNTIPITYGAYLKSSWGSTSGLEGTYYFDRHLGVGANASASTATTSVNRGNFSFAGPPLAWYTISLGPVYSITFTKSSRAGAKISSGYVGLMENSFNDYTISATKGFDLTGGIFVEQQITQGMFLKLYTNLEKTYFSDNRFNFLNVTAGASVCLDLGIVCH